MLIQCSTLYSLIRVANFPEAQKIRHRKCIETQDRKQFPIQNGFTAKIKHQGGNINTLKLVSLLCINQYITYFHSDT